MSKHYHRDHFANATVSEVFPASAVKSRRSFDLHPALFAITVGAYLLYVLMMAVTFMAAEMIIPLAIFVITIVAGFGVPALWARVEGVAVAHLPDWHEFVRDGIDTWTGHLSGKEVIAQVMIMPAMLLIWAVAIAVIRASV